MRPANDNKSFFFIVPRRACHLTQTYLVIPQKAGSDVSPLRAASPSSQQLEKYTPHTDFSFLRHIHDNWKESGKKASTEVHSGYTAVGDLAVLSAFKGGLQEEWLQSKQ